MIRALQHPGIDGCPPEASDTCLGLRTPPASRESLPSE